MKTTRVEMAAMVTWFVLALAGPLLLTLVVKGVEWGGDHADELVDWVQTHLWTIFLILNGALSVVLAHGLRVSRPALVRHTATVAGGAVGLILVSALFDNAWADLVLRVIYIAWIPISTILGARLFFWRPAHA